MHQNIHMSLTEYDEQMQQLEKNTVILTMLGHLKEVSPSVIFKKHQQIHIIALTKCFQCFEKQKMY